MLRCSKADRGILIGSFSSSKHISAYWTTYHHISSCRFHLRWSWRGERRLNTGVIRNWRYLTAVGIFVGKIGARSTQNFFTWSLEENRAWLMYVCVKNRIEMQRR
jgi:hypothetical protein